MIAFTRIPESYAPFGGEIHYAVAADAAQRIGIRILRAAETAARSSETLENGVSERPGPTDPSASAGAASDAVSIGTAPSAEGELLGAKRFVGIAEAAFDVAPYLRRAVRFAPSSGGTGFCDASNRTVAATVEAFVVTAAAKTAVVAMTGAATTTGGRTATAGAAARVAEREAMAGVRALGVSEASVAGEASVTKADAGIEKVGAADSVQTVVAPVRTFLPCAEAVAAPALLTVMPRERLMAHGEWDELTFLHEGPLTITVTAEGVASGVATARTYAMPPRADVWSHGGAETSAMDKRRVEAAEGTVKEGVVVSTFRSGAGGLHLFRVNTRDFPGAERLTVDAGNCGKVVYTLLPTPEGARRVAWRTAAGSVEHYTFPVERLVAVKVRKARACGQEGAVATTVEMEHRLHLESACEGRDVLRALAGLIVSPQVWLVEGDCYTAVDVQTDKAEMPGPGMPGVIGIALRSARKTSLPWN